MQSRATRVTVLRTSYALMHYLKLENPLESLEDRIAIHMNRFLHASLVFSSSSLKHGLAPFAACSRGQGLSGSVTYQTREVTRCSPLPVVFVGIKLPEF